MIHVCLSSGHRAISGFHHRCQLFLGYYNLIYLLPQQIHSKTSDAKYFRRVVGQLYIPTRGEIVQISNQSSFNFLDNERLQRKGSLKP